MSLHRICLKSIKLILLLMTTICIPAPAQALVDNLEEQNGPAPLLEELIFSESIYPQEKGDSQTKMGFTFDRGDGERHSMLYFELEHGITEHLLSPDALTLAAGGELALRQPTKTTCDRTIRMLKQNPITRLSNRL